MERSRRMKKFKFRCMIFMFSSLCILLPCCPLASSAKSTETLMSGPVVVSHVWPKMGIRPSIEPRTSSHWWVQDYHRGPPQLHPRHRFRSASSHLISLPQELSVSLEPANKRSIEEATEDCTNKVTGNCKGESIPEWLEDFTKNLEIAEVPVPADISHDPVPKRPTKLASRKHSF